MLSLQARLRSLKSGENSIFYFWFVDCHKRVSHIKASLMVRNPCPCFFFKLIAEGAHMNNNTFTHALPLSLFIERLFQEKMITSMSTVIISFFLFFFALAIEASISE